MHVVCNVLMKLDTHHPDHHAPTLSLSLSLTLSAYKNQYRERERDSFKTCVRQKSLTIDQNINFP